MENIVAHSLEKLYREFEKADQLKISKVNSTAHLCGGINF